MKTYFPTKEEALPSRNWVVMDAADQTVGRLASKIARALRGKNNPKFTNHVDMGSFVVVINASKVRFTGQKWSQKVYNRHTGFIGNLKSETAEKVFAKHPERVLMEAVRGMLPKNPLAKRQILKLKVYAGAEHPHAAQQPVEIN